MNAPSPALIALDWGTSSLRAYLIDGNGSIAAIRSGPEGVLVAGSLGFDTVFERYVEDWFASHGDLPVIMSGMIGSRQGWVEAPYRDCPAGLDEIACSLITHATRKGRLLHIVPGLRMDGAGAAPDVVRGEETQLIGCLAGPRQGAQTFVLPGTHSKWAVLDSGRIETFATFMTGEIYAALKGHTILGRLMTSDAHDDDAFAKGVSFGAREDAKAGRLLRKLFSVRTRGLFEEVPSDGLAAYLSGLLIGSEVAEAKDSGLVQPNTPVTIVGTHFLCNLYRRALAQCGINSHNGPADAAASGLAAIARARGLLS